MKRCQSCWSFYRITMKDDSSTGGRRQVLSHVDRMNPMNEAVLLCLEKLTSGRMSLSIAIKRIFNSGVCRWVSGQVYGFCE